MAKNKKVKKVIITKPKVKPTASKLKEGPKTKESAELVFKQKNYWLILAAFLLVAIGLLLMTGGKMPSPNVWDDSLIYSFRRVTLAPIVIIAGLVVGVYAILKN